MSAQLLSGIVATALSLGLSYIPGLAPWWKALSTVQKQAGTGLMILASAAGTYAVACYTEYFGLVCPDLPTVAGSVLAALVASQSIYKLSKG